MASWWCWFLFQHYFSEFLTKSIFGKIWTKKVKVVHFGWKLAYRVPRWCSVLFWHYFCQFPCLNPFLDKFGSKSSNLFILTKNWHTCWFLFQQYFFEFPTLNPFLGKFGLTKSKLFVLLENWHTRTYTQCTSKMLILISVLVFS